MAPIYATLEDTKRALDVAETARSDDQVLRALESGSRSIESLTHRRFYPLLATRYFDWPNRQYARPWRLWLDDQELISVTTLLAGGVTIPSTDYFLEPANTGPPYTRIEIDLSSGSAFASGATYQRAVVVTGLFGHSADEAPAGALAAAVDNSQTTVNVTDSSLIDVGTIVRAGDERMIVTGRGMLDTGQTIAGYTLTASSSDVNLDPITAGTLHVGEVLLVGSERMLVVDVAGASVTVRRAWDGSVLDVHNSGAPIYALRTLQVERGALGTTAAAHADTTPLAKHVVPPLVRDLTIAEAINQLQMETSGYARVIGEGDNARDGTGRSLYQLRKDVVAAFGRQVRSRAV